MVAEVKSEEGKVDILIKMSRAALEPARNAVAIAKEFDRNRAQWNAELRKLHQNAGRLIQELEDQVEVARKTFVWPAASRHSSK